MGDLLKEAQGLFEYSQRLRRDFHRHPELGFQEYRTAGVIVNELSQLGLEVTSGVAKTGVVALLEGEEPGPVVLLRFDMDALPIQEETQAEYASTVPGVMHACGHDGHVAVGLTVARLLNQRRKGLRGTVKFVFQPAEEGQGGAEAMLREGVLTKPAADYSLAFHLWNERPVGWVALVPGLMMAGADAFTVRIIGKGGHGAVPNQSVDPVVAAAAIINGLQTVVSRNISPLQSAVISVTQVNAGETFNVIPSSVVVRGTFRTFENEVRQKMIDRFQKLVQNIAEAFDCQAEIEVRLFTPAVINDAATTRAVLESVQESLAGIRVEHNYRTMVSDDMAYFMQSTPGTYLLVGSANHEKGLDYGHHHPKFDIDEAALPVAATILTAATLKLLNTR